MIEYDNYKKMKRIRIKTLSHQDYKDKFYKPRNKNEFMQYEFYWIDAIINTCSKYNKDLILCNQPIADVWV